MVPDVRGGERGRVTVMRRGWRMSRAGTTLQAKISQGWTVAAYREPEKAKGKPMKWLPSQRPVTPRATLRMGAVVVVLPGKNLPKTSVWRCLPDCRPTAAQPAFTERTPGAKEPSHQWLAGSASPLSGARHATKARHRFQPAIRLCPSNRACSFLSRVNRSRMYSLSSRPGKDMSDRCSS